MTKSLKKKRTSKEEDAMRRAVKKLNKWKTREEEFEFMKRKNVNVLVLENDLDENRMNLFIFKRLILKMNLQINDECLSRYD
jgi:predicted Zn-dependent peptidase